MNHLQLNSLPIHGSNGPRLLITAGVHGDEFEPMLAVRELATRLSSENIAGTVTLVPIVNQDAFARGERTAEDGLDLARVCPGRADGSITEQTAAALSILITQADYYLDLHTGGRLFTLLPLAGYVLHQNPAILQQQRRMARAFNLPLVWGTTPTLHGRSLSVARDARVPAIYIEHGGGAELNPQAVADLIDGCLNVMDELQMIARPRPPSRIAHLIEDPRDQSGYLQISHPSPCDGIFHAAVKTGDWVQQGAIIGRITHPATAKAAHMHAQETGVVVMLRAFAHVNAGDALASIAPAQSQSPKDSTHAR